MFKYFSPFTNILAASVYYWNTLFNYCDPS